MAGDYNRVTYPQASVANEDSETKTWVFDDFGKPCTHLITVAIVSASDDDCAVSSEAWRASATETPPLKCQCAFPHWVATHHKDQPAPLLAVYSAFKITVLQKRWDRNIHRQSRFSQLPNFSGCCTARVPCVKSPVQSCLFLSSRQCQLATSMSEYHTPGRQKKHF